MAEMNGTGKGGKSFQDRELAAKVRTLALNKIKQILERPMEDELQKAVILRLAGTVLPRLNEITGEDGGEIKVAMNAITIRTYDSREPGS